MDLEKIISGFNQNNYIASDELATILHIALQIQKPVLLEGNPGVGKTDVAIVLSELLDTELIRLQCYEGLDVNSAVYEWNYQKQLLSIKMMEQQHLDTKAQEEYVFSEDFLLERPLLRSIKSQIKSPVLLIDEVDRADEEFEAFLLELLSAYQISIPEIGTIKAVHKPIVILTSNRTRELSDALKRRCLYHWVDFPSFEKECRIVQMKFPELNERISTDIVQFVQGLRNLKLSRKPGIAETLDWAHSLNALGAIQLDEELVQKTLGVVVKSSYDQEAIKPRVHELLSSATN